MFGTGRPGGIGSIVASVTWEPVVLWCSCVRHQSGNPEVVGSRPAVGEKLSVGRTFSG